MTGQPAAHAKAAVFALAAGLGMAAGVARADPPPRVALRWSAPAACPTSADVAAEVDRILGETGARPAKPLDVSADVKEAAGGFRVRVETSGPDGPRVRTVQGKTCSAVADAAALVIALILDPNAVPPAPKNPVEATAPVVGPSPVLAPSPVAPPPSPQPVSAPPVPVAPLPAPVPPPSRPVQTPRPPPPALVRRDDPSPSRTPILDALRVGAWAGIDVGSLPSAAPGFGLDAAIVLANVRLELGAELFPNSRKVIANTVAGGSVLLGAGELTAGYAFRAPKNFELTPLATFELGELHATGFGVTNTSSGSAFWEALGVGGQAAWFPVRAFGITLRSEAAFPFSRGTFVLENVGAQSIAPVYRPSSAVLRIALGVEFRL